MRTVLAFGVALLVTGPVFGADAAGQLPAAGMQVAAATGSSGGSGSSTLRGSVPRTTGTGLTGMPVGGGTILGVKPLTAVLIGAAVIGAAILIVGSQNDDDNTQGSGSGSGSGP